MVGTINNGDETRAFKIYHEGGKKMFSAKILA